MSDIDNLLDATLDDLEDLPEFKPFPAGAHRILATLSLKKINDKQAVELDMKAIETAELVNDSDEPVKEGDSTSVAFMLDNEFGRGNLKKVTTPLAAGLGMEGATLRDIIEAVTDAECVVVTAIRKDKNDPDKQYTNIKAIEVV